MPTQTPEKTEDVPTKWSVLVKPSLKNRLLRVAKMEGRTLTKILEMVLEKGLDELYPMAA